MFLSKDLFDFNLNPFENFANLFEEAKKNPNIDPTVMTLATVDSLGRPRARVVLLKQVDHDEFVFYTNYESAKASEMKTNPSAALVFFWAPLAIQIRIEGTISKVTREESEAYFKTRPRLSQLGAWASKQSDFIDSYETLEVRMAKITEMFLDKEVPCPEKWGGYRVKPDFIEFWFGMEGRLHYRYCYEKSGSTWIRAMKSP